MLEMPISLYDFDNAVMCFISLSVSIVAAPAVAMMVSAAMVTAAAMTRVISVAMVMFAAVVAAPTDATRTGI